MFINKQEGKPVNSAPLGQVCRKCPRSSSSGPNVSDGWNSLNSGNSMRKGLFTAKFYSFFAWVVSFSYTPTICLAIFAQS